MSSAATAGTLTALETTPPVSAATTCSAAWKPARSVASAVEAPEVRRDDDVGAPEERVLGDRLGAEDVERRAADLARVQRGLEVLVDDQRPAGDVEHAHAVLALGQRLGVEPALGLRRLGQVQGQEVGLGVDVVGGLGLLDAEVAVALGAHERVEGDDAHPEALGAMGHELADAPEAEDPERLVEQLDARELRALPLAGDQAGVRLGHVAGQREQQRHRVLGGGDDVGLRRVGHDDAALGRGGDVDVVDAHAGAADGLQARRALDDVGRELRRRADEDPVVLVDAVEVVALVDVEVLAQQRHAGGADLLGDEDAHQSPSRSTTQSMQAVSACTSARSIAGKSPMRSWLRPSLR